MDLSEEQRLLASMDRSYRDHGEEIHKEMGAWLDAALDRPSTPLPSERAS